MSVKITTLIENNEDDNSMLYYEHGLSLFIETDGINIIFDTGQSSKFIENARKLRVDLKKANYVILSHGHYDHTGGFTSLVNEIGNSFKLIVSDKFTNNKYSVYENSFKYIGNSFDDKYLKDNNIEVNFINKDIYYVSKNAFVASNFMKNTKFEILNDRFVIKSNDYWEKDAFLDEIVLGIKVKKGLLVILGCSHVGIVNILETLIERTNMPIYAVIGGTHLKEANELRLIETIEFFKDKDIKLIAVSHCTGEKAIESLKCEFKDRFFYNNTGNKIEIE